MMRCPRPPSCGFFFFFGVFYGCFGAVPASGGGSSRRVSSAWEEGGCAAAARGNPLRGAETEASGDGATPWGAPLHPGGPRSPGLQGMGWMGSAIWGSCVTGRGWWLGVKAGIMTYGMLTCWREEGERSGEAG